MQEALQVNTSMQRRGAHCRQHYCILHALQRTCTEAHGTAAIMPLCLNRHQTQTCLCARSSMQSTHLQLKDDCLHLREAVEVYHSAHSKQAVDSDEMAMQDCLLWHFYIKCPLTWRQRLNQGLVAAVQYHRHSMMHWLQTFCGLGRLLNRVVQEHPMPQRTWSEGVNDALIVREHAQIHVKNRSVQLLM